MKIGRYVLCLLQHKKNHTKLSDGEDFLYSIGNYEYSQYHIILGKGKNLKKDIYIYIYMNHCAIHLKLIQCCKSTIRQFKFF